MTSHVRAKTVTQQIYSPILSSTNSPPNHAIHIDPNAPPPPSPPTSAPPTTSVLFTLSHLFNVQIPEEKHLLHLIRDELKLPLPNGWYTAVTEDGHQYYYHTKVNIRTYIIIYFIYIYIHFICFVFVVSLRQHGFVQCLHYYNNRLNMHVHKPQVHYIYRPHYQQHEVHQYHVQLVVVHHQHGNIHMIHNHLLYYVQY
jgi:hypothetical protein